MNCESETQALQDRESPSIAGHFRVDKNPASEARRGVVQAASALLNRRPLWLVTAQLRANTSNRRTND